MLVKYTEGLLLTVIKICTYSASIDYIIKGTVPRDFRPHSNPPRLLTNGVKIFSILVSFSPRYLYFSVEKTDYPQYDTARSLTPRSIILCWDSEKYEYLSENETKFETILTHWSVAQAGSNDEKNLFGLSL